jgi:hypothetical protein
MTRFATGSLAVLQPGHPFAKLTAVRIAMAPGACPVLKAELGRAFERTGSRRFVAVRAWGSQVTAYQGKSRFLVLSQGKRRGPESLDGMASFATVRMRRGLELPEMDIAVTIGALSELDLEQRRFSRG